MNEDNHTVWLPAQLNKVIDEVWSLILGQLDQLPLCRIDNRLAMLKKDKDGNLAVKLVTSIELFGILIRLADWMKELANGDARAAEPPPKVIQEMLYIAHHDLPDIERVINTPYFASNGQLITKPGYRVNDRTFYAPAPDLVNFDPVEKVSGLSLAGARSILVDEMLGDFPFKQPCDLAHTLAPIITFFIQQMIPGCIPPFIIGAPLPGGAKTLLAQVIALLLSGKKLPATTLPGGDDAIKRQIISQLASGQQLVLIDNLDERRMLRSPTLASLGTTEVFEKPKFHDDTKMLRVKNNAIFLITGNNPSLSQELLRRFVPINLVWDVEDPARLPEDHFNHPDLLDWIISHRADLIDAVVTIINAWIQAGKPLFTKRNMGSFTKWSGIVGGILEVAGIDGFLGHQENDTNDLERMELRDIITTWVEVFGQQPIRPSELEHICSKYEIGDIFLGSGTTKSRQTKAGMFLYGLRDRIINGYRINLVQNLGKHKGRRYGLEPVAERSADVPLQIVGT